MAMSEYLGGAEGPMTVGLGLELDLPVGQGFGMSGAMTFASLMALEGELGLMGGDVDALLSLAHAAELAFRTGLGDVVAQARGGLDLRVRPGLPPKGDVVTRLQEGDVIVAWSKRSLSTDSVLSDQDARRRLKAAYITRTSAPSNGPDLDWLLREGWAFAMEAGLVSKDVQRMVDICSTYGVASQVMLGNSVFAVGDLDAMAFDLWDAGFTHRITTVDNVGVRMLD
jgi:pantoate kinase